MGRPLSSPLHVARHLLMSDKAWLLFVEAPRVAGGFWRLVRNNRNLSANGAKWHAAEMSIELPAEDAEGSLGRASVTISNVSRLPMAAIEGSELLGQMVTFYLQHEANLATFDPSLGWSQLILSADVTERAARLECGHPAQVARVPSRVFTRKDFPGLLPVGVR